MPMKDYVCFISDRSFDYYDGPNATIYNYEANGFEIDQDPETDTVDISTLKGFGEFKGIEENIKTEKDLDKFLNDIWGELDSEQTSISEFETLLEILEEQEEKKKGFLYLKGKVLQGYYDSLRETDEDDDNRGREEYEEMRANMELEEQLLNK